MLYNEWNSVNSVEYCYVAMDMNYFCLQDSPHNQKDKKKEETQLFGSKPVWKRKAANSKLNWSQRKLVNHCRPLKLLDIKLLGGLYVNSFYNS